MHKNEYIHRMRSMSNLIEIRDATIDRVNALRKRGRGVNTLTEKLSKTSNMQSWLSRFSRGKIKNPGIETLQSVIDALNEIESVQTDTPKQSSLGLPEHSECGTGVSL